MVERKEGGKKRGGTRNMMCTKRWGQGRALSGKV